MSARRVLLSYSIQFTLIVTFLLVPASSAFAQQTSSDEVHELRNMVLLLQQRVNKLESQLANKTAVDSSVHLASDSRQPVPSTADQVPESLQQPTVAAPAAGQSDHEFIASLRGTTLNVAIDTYYDYNFNHPVGRVNLLRAYDVLSNNFSLNQASVVFERAADLDAGRRFGARVDRTRLSNAPVLSREVVMKFEDERRAGYSGTASASQFSGDSAVGGRVCSERFAAERVLPATRSGAEYSQALSEAG